MRDMVLARAQVSNSRAETGFSAPFLALSPASLMRVTEEARCTEDAARPRLWLPRCSRFMTAFTAPVSPWKAASAIAVACAGGNEQC